MHLRNPEAIRPWQLVHEPVFGYVQFVQDLASDAPTPPSLNFGPNPGDERTVREVVERLLALVGRGTWEATSDREGPEASVLAIDPSLALETIGWQPCLSLDDALGVDGGVVQRRRRPASDCRALCIDQISRYRALVER